MFINNFDPVAFSILNLDIRWYSLAYIFGIGLGWVFCKKFLINDDKLNEKFDDYITYIIFGIILGGRLGYIIFYNLNYYLDNLVDIFKIWEGGMSFHGGLIGIILSTILFARKYRDDIFIYTDLVALVAPIGIFFGRLANFINSELYGIPSTVPWAVIFIKIDDLARHPSQLYEAIFEGVILFLILLYFRNKSSYKRNGLISALFLIFYSVFRFFAEFLREPDEQLGYLIFDLTMGQIMSILFALTGIILFYIKNEDKKIN